MRNLYNPEKLYIFEPDSLHHYVIVIPNKKIDANKLKFSYQLFNVDNYNQNDLKVINIELDTARSIMVIKQFKNSGNAQLYFLELLNKKVLEEYSLISFNHFIISNGNFIKFIKDQNTEKYLKFYDEKYQN